MYGLVSNAILRASPNTIGNLLLFNTASTSLDKPALTAELGCSIVKYLLSLDINILTKKLVNLTIKLSTIGSLILVCHDNLFSKLYSSI